MALVAFGIIVALTLVSAAAPLLAPYPPSKTLVGTPLQPPSTRNILGTDDLGRDILSGVLYGIRISLLVGVGAAVASCSVGVLLGVLSGYYGGFLDEIAMRLAEAFLVIPSFLLAVVLVALLGNSIVIIMTVIALLSWPSTARLVRAEVLRQRQQEYVEAARAIGCSSGRIIFRAILPNALSPAIVNTSVQMANAILVEAGLSFLGLGDPNVQSLGSMLQRSQGYLRMAWWMSIFPGSIIFMLALCGHLVGDGLNDALNPRSP